MRATLRGHRLGDQVIEVLASQSPLADQPAETHGPGQQLPSCRQDRKVARKALTSAASTFPHIVEQEWQLVDQKDDRAFLLGQHFSQVAADKLDLVQNRGGRERPGGLSPADTVHKVNQLVDTFGRKFLR